MANVTVIGAQWGDEGKGKIVDWLASRADAVVRFQGGHNAGHTLVVGNQTYKLSLLPSGIVTGTLSVIGNGVVLDPWHFRDEVAKLRGQGVEITPDNLQVLRGNFHALPAQLGNLVAEVPRIEHHAIADDRQGAAHNARGQQAQLIGLVADDQRMPRIMPALKADNDIGAAGKPIDNLALALIAPLRANYGYICQLLRPFRLERPCRLKGYGCRVARVGYPRAKARPRPPSLRRAIARLC